MKHRIVSLATVLCMLMSVVAVMPSTANAATQTGVHTFAESQSSASTSTNAIQSNTQFGTNWYISGNGAQATALNNSGTAVNHRGENNIWGSLKGNSVALLFQPFTVENATDKVIYYNFDYTMQGSGNNAIYTKSYTTDSSSLGLDSGNSMGVGGSAGMMSLSAYNANDISVIIDNTSKTVYYYKGTDLKGTKTVSDTQTSLGFRGDNSNRSYFNNISYGYITPEIAGADTIAAGSGRTYAITEAGEVSIPHPDFKLGLAEEVAGVTLSNNSVTVADTVEAGTKITLNVSMGDGTGVIATKEITVTDDIVENTAYSLIATETETNKNNEAFRGKEIDFNITDNIKLHFGNSTTGTAMSASNGVDLRNDGGYIVFSPDKDGILHIKGVMRSNSKLQMSTTGYGNGSSVRSTVTSNTNYDDVDIPVAQGSTYYIYNDGNNPTSINTLTYKYTREAFDGIKGYVNRATNTYTFQIGNAEAATVKETQVKADENKYVDMAVYLGRNDSLIQGTGINFTNGSISNDTTGTTVATEGRYIIVTPKYDGTFNLKITFPGASSSNKCRVYYAEVTEDNPVASNTKTASFVPSNSNNGITSTNPTTLSIPMKAGKSYVIYTYKTASTISEINYTYDKTIGIDYENEKFTNIIDGDYTITGEGLEKSLSTGSNSAIAIDNSYFVGDITISGTGDGNVISQSLTLTRPAAPDVTTDYTVTQPETANEKGTVTAQNGANLQYSTDGSEWTDVPEEIAQGTTFYLRKAATDSAFASTATEEITIDTISVPTYTVTWKVEGQEDNVQSLDYGAAIEAPQEPEKAEDNGHTYTFEGWHLTTAEGEKVESFGTVSGDVTYVAVFTSVNKTFDVTYHSDHGTQPEAATYTYGTGIAELPQLTDTNYSFDGWYDGADFTTANEVTSISASDFGDKNLYAKWTAKNYTITYNTNGGSAVAEATAAYDTIIPVPNSNPTKSGYEFSGWYTNEQLTTPLADGAKVTGNQTLYAKWTPISYSVTKVSMTNGTVNLNTATATVEDEITVTIVPDTGYQLASLTVGSEAVTGDALTNAINSNSYTFNMPAKAVEVSATFERKAVNKVEVTLDNSTATHGTATTINATAKVYAADNTDITSLYASDIVWSLDDATTTGGKTTISDNGASATVSVGVEQAVGTVTVTATVGGKSDNKAITVSSEPTYTITVDNTITGGTVTTTPSGSTTKGQTVTITATPDDGYQLKADSVKVNGGAVTVTNNTFTMPEENVTVTAEFELKTYTITWKNWNGETLTTTEVEHGTVPSYPNDAAAPAKDSDSEYDYTFDKWTPNLTEATAAAEYTATYTQVAKEAPKTFLNLHEGFSSWLKIEKTNAADSDDVVLTVSKDQESQNDIPTLTAYIAVYNNGVLQSVKKHDFVSSAVTLPASEATGEYKIFIWADQMEPVIEAVTPNITGANKLFD